MRVANTETRKKHGAPGEQLCNSDGGGCQNLWWYSGLGRWDNPCDGPCISSRAAKVLGGAGGMASYALTCTAGAVSGTTALVGTVGSTSAAVAGSKFLPELAAPLGTTIGGSVFTGWAGGLGVAFYVCYF